jgi:hypothetical protein
MLKNQRLRHHRSTTDLGLVLALDHNMGGDNRPEGSPGEHDDGDDWLGCIVLVL